MEYVDKLGSIVEVEESEPGVKGKKALNDVAVAVALGCVLAVERAVEGGKSATCIRRLDL